MAQNTAMQEAINKFDNLNPYQGFTAQEVVNILLELLPKERQDIEDAGSKCQIVNDVSFDGDIDFMYKSGSDYFNKTFTQNK